MTSAWKSLHLFPVEWKGPGKEGSRQSSHHLWRVGRGCRARGARCSSGVCCKATLPSRPFSQGSGHHRRPASSPLLQHDPPCPAPPGASCSRLSLRWAGPLAPLHPARGIDEPRDLSPGSRGERPGPALARPQPRMNNNSLTARPLKGSSSRTHFWKGWGFLFPR